MPFVVRAVHPLLSPSAPPLLQAVALRMVCTMWVSTGRGFAHLRESVLSYTQPAHPALRLAWAETLTEMCLHAGEDKVPELVHAVYQCLTVDVDAQPEVVAAGLKSVAALCESDILDFYKTWRVVRPLFPTLPSHPEPAAAWVRLLASGGLDADFHPEIARGVVDALWAAMQHAAPAVRQQAYASLAAFDMSVLESIDALSPLRDYAALLQWEHNAGALRHCRALVREALTREHSERRRARGVTATATQQQRDANSVLYKISVSIPKSMLGAGGNTVTEFLKRVPDVPPPAALFFWAPPHSAPGIKGSTDAALAAAAAAKEAAAGYERVFRAIICGGRVEEGLGGCSEVGSPLIVLLEAWTAFLRRWCAAHRASAPSSKGTTTPVRKHEEIGVFEEAIESVWKCIRPHLKVESSVTTAVNATWAAAALCTAHPQPSKSVVTAVRAAMISSANWKPCWMEMNPFLKMMILWIKSIIVSIVWNNMKLKNPSKSSLNQN